MGDNIFTTNFEGEFKVGDLVRHANSRKDHVSVVTLELSEGRWMEICSIKTGKKRMAWPWDLIRVSTLAYMKAKKEICK